MNEASAVDSMEEETPHRYIVPVLHMPNLKTLNV